MPNIEPVCLVLTWFKNFYFHTVHVQKFILQRHVKFIAAKFFLSSRHKSNWDFFNLHCLKPKKYSRNRGKNGWSSIKAQLATQKKKAEEKRLKTNRTERRPKKNWANETNWSVLSVFFLLRHHVSLARLTCLSTSPLFPLWFPRLWRWEYAGACLFTDLQVI